MYQDREVIRKPLNNFTITAIILGAGRRALISFRIAAASSCYATSWRTRNAFYVRYRAHRTRSLATRLSTIKRRDRRSPGIVVRTRASRAKGSFAWVYTRNCFTANALVVSSALDGKTSAGCEEQLHEWIISSVGEPPFEGLSPLSLPFCVISLKQQRWLRRNVNWNYAVLIRIEIESLKYR